MRRRALLKLAATAASGSILGSCARASTEETHLIFLTTAAGVSVLDQNGRVVTAPTVVSVATPGWDRVVTAQPDGAGTRVVIQDLASQQVFSANTLHDRLEPRVVSPDGQLVASVTPGGAGIYGLHEPGGRERTTVVVSSPAGERVRLDLPGNIEPEAFSPDGNQLFVLDYVPAAKPERFRPGAIDLVARELKSLAAQQETRAHRIESSYDSRRTLHLTLYSYEPEGIAFVHCLHLREGWTRRIDLPAPFGRERPGVNAIALSPLGDRFCAVHAPSATVVDIDLDQLMIKQVGRFADTGQAGKPNVRITASGRLIVNVDRRVIVSDPRLEIPTPGEARGLVPGAGNDIWVGHPNGVVRYDLATGKEITRFTVPDLFVVKHVRG